MTQRVCVTFSKRKGTEWAPQGNSGLIKSIFSQEIRTSEETEELWQEMCESREGAEQNIRKLPGIGMDQRISIRH